MCLVIDKSHKFLWRYKAKRAKRPITVYKILKFTNYSPFLSYQYHTGLNYPKVIGPRLLKDNFIRSGYLHAYQSLSKAEQMAYRFSRHNGIEFLKVIEMTIPEGSLYFIGCYGEICASCLKW